MKHLQTKFTFIKRSGLASGLLVVFLLFTACQLDLEEQSETRSLQNLTYYFTKPGEPDPANKAALLDVITSSEREIVAVFNSFTDQEVTDALLERYEAGVDIYMAGDFHSNTDAGFRRLNAQDEIEIKFSDSNLDTEPRRSGRVSDSRDLPPRDGRVETNVLIADKRSCWVSTAPPTRGGFENSYAVSIKFLSTEICTDFFNDARLMAQGGLFSDEGGKLVTHANDRGGDEDAVQFSQFSHNKGIPDPNYRFRLGEHIIYTFFAWQERPLNTLITRLLRSRNSIEFAAKAITNDVIRDRTDPTMNRSHILNAFEYKSRIPEEFDGDYSIRGVFSEELIGISDIGGTPLGTAGRLDSRMSIHKKMNALPNIDLKKNAGQITFNLYVVDKGTQYAQIILLSSDLRLRYYENGFNTNPDFAPMSRQVESVREDYYDITDAFMLIIEPSGNHTEQKIYNDFSGFINEIYNGGSDI